MGDLNLVCRCSGLSVLVLLTVLLTEVQGSGWFSLSMVNYTNPSGHGNNGKCCDSKFSSARMCRLNPCDHYFTVCMGNVSRDATTMDDSCDLMHFVTDEIEDEDSIVFGNTIGDLENPQTGLFTSWPVNFQITVDIMDQDSGLFSRDDLVEKMRQVFTITPSMADDDMLVHHIPIRGRTELHMSLVVRCDQNYYGPSCECQPADDDINGHYDCDNDGNKICHPGWADWSGCTHNINECYSEPCQNGGTCIDHINEFTCQCPMGYIGEFCHYAYDDTTNVWLNLMPTNFTNPTGHGDNGNCCDNVVPDQSVCQINPCDHYFVICLSSVTSTDFDTISRGDCDIVYHETTYIPDQDQDIYLPDYITSYSSDATWPGTFHMKVDVWDHDSGYFDSDDLVDRLRDTFTIYPPRPLEFIRQYLQISGRTTFGMWIELALDNN